MCLLGIVIPVYNGEKYVREAIESVVTQPCKDLILVVVNDGSSDNSEQIIREEKEKYNNIYSIYQENQGVSVARNNGISFLLEKGVSYIGFLDADDIWVPGFYTNELSETIKEKYKDVYQFSHYWSNDNLTRLKEHKSSSFDECSGSLNRYDRYFCSYFYKVELFKHYCIKFPDGMKVQEDESFKYIFFTIAKTFLALERYIFIYRSNTASVVHRKITKYDENIYLNNHIPAWDWVKKELMRLHSLYTELGIRKSDIEQCDVMKKTYAVDAIINLCELGVSMKHIQKSIDSYSLYQMIENEYYLDEGRKKTIDRFKKHPYLMKYFFRSKAITMNVMRRLRNNRIVQAKRYPLLSQEVLDKE